jgi:hypothetical protein
LATEDTEDAEKSNNSIRYTPVIVTVDRKAISVGSLHDEPDERRWWWQRTPLERLAAIEVMRRVVYGRAAVDGRLQRVFDVAQRESR